MKIYNLSNYMVLRTHLTGKEVLELTEKQLNEHSIAMKEYWKENNEPLRKWLENNIPNEQ